MGDHNEAWQRMQSSEDQNSEEHQQVLMTDPNNYKLPYYEHETKTTSDADTSSYQQTFPTFAENQSNMRHERFKDRVRQC